MLTPDGSIGDYNVGGWRFENTFSKLPNILFDPANPAAVRSPRVTIVNYRLAHELGLDFDALSPETAAALFAGQILPAGSYPIAQAYAGYQFGGFTMLGDWQ
ncbi:MAG: protein adenylyltransferase SelO family protein [Pirellulaceae bacterium]|nr:protein adenylyltransferase SelO family protein [Pirellulaceae bacterium]